MGCGPTIALSTPLKLLSCNHLLMNGNDVFMFDWLMARTGCNALGVCTASSGAVLIAVPMISIPVIAFAFDVAVLIAFAFAMGRWQLRKVTKSAWSCFAVFG